VVIISFQKKGKAKNDGVGLTSVKLRYYSKSEYNKLSGKQKKELHKWRRNKSKKNTSNGDGDSSKISALETQL